MAVRTLVSGRGLVEAPRWHGDRLYFSDWDAHEVIAVDPGGRAEVVASVASFPLCTDWLPDGRLLLVSSDDKCLLRRDHDGSMAPYADLSAVADRTWNDIVVDGRGNAYVNGVSFTAGPDAGLVVLVTPDGVARQVADGLAFPNGMAVTPDNATLIVADSHAQQLVGFDIAEDGTLSDRRTWADVAGHPDGICIDAENAVWYADVGEARCVRVAQGGRVLATVDHDRGCFACVLGGPERTTLYVTAAEWQGWEKGVARGSGQLVATEVSVPGAGWP